MLNNIFLNGIKQTYLVFGVILIWAYFCSALTEKRRLELKDKTKEMFDHGWNNYYQHAFPEDELNPFKCKGRGSDKANPSNINVNDVLGDYSLTLVDTLDTLAVLGTQEQFEEAVNRVIETVSFSQDNKVQVFELNIRALGGLLSAHMFATDPSFNHTIKGYNDELLWMAKDLADRLMPAFQSTKSGIPFPRVNLKRGVPPTETTETCTAGAGSLILEFGVLSRLLNDSSYEHAAKKALYSVWNRRSNINLLGNVIDIQTGNWIHTASSTGAGIDSVFEYMLKAYVLFGEEEYKDMFDQAYKALLLYVRDATGYLYRNVHMSTGSLMSYWIDSLSAFFPGLQVLHGDIDSAIKNHLVYYNIWRRYHALPERFDFYQKAVDLPFYPLRPEFIESTYHLYQATKDPFYLEVGEMVLEDLNNRTRVPCGFASIGDVQTGRLEDRMESFMLSETLKYLYLLFDTDHAVNKMDSNFIFTTEGHILPLPGRYLKHKATTPKKNKGTVSLQSTAIGTCQRYNPHGMHFISIPGNLDMSSIPFQPQTDYASEIVGYTSESYLPPLSAHGYCEAPFVASRSFSLSFSGYSDYYRLLDTNRYKANNIIDMLGGYLAKSLSGLRIEVVGGRKNDGFIVKGVSPNISLKDDETLTFSMSAFFPYLASNSDIFQLQVKQPKITTRIRNYLQSDNEISVKTSDEDQCYEYLGVRSDFGPTHINIGHGGVYVFGDEKRLFGCEPYTYKDARDIRGRILLVSRGNCGFYDKVINAQSAGAKAVIFLNNRQNEEPFTAAASNMKKKVVIPSFMISQKDALSLIKMRTKPLETFQVNDLPSIDDDPNAIISLLYRGERIKNVVIINVEMEYVGKLGSLFTSVHNFYNEINPATLSGAIDIVVVEQEDGDLACSPFHVRFGKLSVLMPQEKRVQIKVNGEVVPYVMKVGEAGEAFFVFETEHEVPEEFQTSPIMDPVPEKNDEDPPYLDIGESKDTTKDETTTAQEDSFEDEERQQQQTDNNKLLPLPAELQSPKMIIEEQMDKVVTKLDPYNKLSANEEKEELNGIKDNVVSDAIDTLKQNTDELVSTPAAKNDIYPMDDGSSLLERVIPEAITTTTIAKERFIVRPAHGDIYSTWMDVTHTSVHKRDEDDNNTNDSTNNNTNTIVDENTGHGKGDESIVLDIAGYKTGGDEENWDDEKRRQDAETIVKKEIINHLFLNKDSCADHEDILSKADVEEAVKDQVVPTLLDDEKTEVGNDDEKTEVAPVVEEEKKEEPKRSLWGWGTRRQATNDSLDVPTSPPVVPVEEQAKKDKESNLEMQPGTTYRIEMSLCGFSAFGRDPKENAAVFDQHITTYDNFTHNPNMLNDKRLVFRYEGRYYAAGHTGPLFTSLLLFKKPLEDAAEDNEKVSDSRESYQFGKGWRQWLSRSSVAAPTGAIIENEQNKKLNDTTTPTPPPTSEDAQKETTTFTTTTTTTSVGWSADHVHPGQEQSEPFPGPPRKVYAKTLRLTSDQLKSLNLKKGVNTISFSVSSAYQGTATCAAKIFYWDYGISVVISDIDGTITKSDTLGHVFTMIGKDWTHMGVAKLYTDIANNGYHFLYLTSRAIGQADYTRDYLKKVVQDKYQLPDGPVIMSPDRLFTSLHREVIMRKPEVFKMACLRDVQRLFGGRDPFYAGFGNRITDARSYRSVNVPTSRIFTIDPYGDLKLELLLGFKSSYIHLNDLVDQIFPPINRVVNEEYNDWNYWKSPFPEIDIPELDIPLEPTSPKPKPIKPDPSVLPPSSVVASSSNNSRGLLRSFTSRSDSSSSIQSNHSASNRKLSTSSSTPNTFLKSTSRKFSVSSNDESLANDTDVTSDQKASVAIASSSDNNNETSSIISTSPDSVSGSIMNKMTSGFGGVRSTLSRTFLSSSSANSDSGVTTPPIVEEEEGTVEDKTSKKELVNEDEDEDDSKKIQEDVDSLLDDIDMDDIPFI